jgi:hypothetical protein
VVIARGERDAVLEDTLYLRKGELSEGSDPLVERTVAMARSLDLPVADVEEAAALLRLARPEAGEGLRADSAGRGGQRRGHLA